MQKREPIFGPIAPFFALYMAALGGFIWLFGYSLWFWLFALFAYGLFLGAGALLSEGRRDATIGRAQIIEHPVISSHDLQSPSDNLRVLGREHGGDALGNTLIDVTPPGEKAPHNSRRSHLGWIEIEGSVSPESTSATSESDFSKLPRGR